MGDERHVMLLLRLLFKQRQIWQIHPALTYLEAGNTAYDCQSALTMCAANPNAWCPDKWNTNGSCPLKGGHVLQEGSRSQPESARKLTGNLVTRMAAVCCMHTLGCHAGGSPEHGEGSGRPATSSSSSQAAAGEIHSCDLNKICRELSQCTCKDRVA